ncbi:MAG: superoxide dismutase [Puniceicoccales bacterium]|jgi:Fe-Mn family superoxide dismutase|nr:superoxide dismutase [Puniceicoccales bacterium]
MSYELPQLEYSYDAIEPYIDTKTMELHHSKHHATYVSNLNKLLAEVGHASGESIEKFLAWMSELGLPDSHLERIKFNAGGHHNHSLFWTVISPSTGNNEPNGILAEAICKSFGTFEDFRETFEKAALSHLGSGWVWLCVDQAKKQNPNHLFVCSTHDHDAPNMGTYSQRPGTPILLLDLWEHAYYLKYNNRKADYIKNFWPIVNWKKVAEYHADASVNRHD